MNPCNIKSNNYQKKNFQYNLLCFCILLLSSAVKAKNDASLNDLFNQATAAFAENHLDHAEMLIEKLLESSQNEAEHYYLAGRIAGKQAQEANLFSQLSYARAAKKYFTAAIRIDPQHQNAIIGLIRFHQQAPVMAGSDKQSIPELINQLRTIDARAAFTMDAPKLLENNHVKSVVDFYKEALNKPSKTRLGQFQYDAAMWFSAYGHYHQALEIMQSIDLSQNDLDDESTVMRLYQLAKLTAETQTQLDVGIKNIQLYAALPKGDKTIPQDWIDFRLAQLNFLNSGQTLDKTELLKIQSRTSLDELKAKIQSFLEEAVLN
ncbi:MAG: hypothetical protein KDI92_09430 [Xanthomonadales bacterium]|nr:hypothetical protein [Xanthomonadales bacterium]